MLFGSYAKGTVHERSDVDLLVVANVEDGLDFHQRRARQLAADCFPRLDIVLATPTDLATASTARSPFLQSILTCGITIYMQPPASAPVPSPDAPPGCGPAVGTAVKCV